MSTKKEAYSPEAVLSIITAFSLVQSYTQQATVAEVVAEEMGKTTKQILGKLQWLSRNGQAKDNGEPLYIKRVYTTKQGGDVVKKADIVSAIADKLGIDSDVVASLESATKPSLLLVLAALK